MFSLPHGCFFRFFLAFFYCFFDAVVAFCGPNI